jgi:hypothetical protein
VSTFTGDEPGCGSSDADTSRASFCVDSGSLGEILAAAAASDTYEEAADTNERAGVATSRPPSPTSPPFVALGLGADAAAPLASMRSLPTRGLCMIAWLLLLSPPPLGLVATAHA